MRTRSEADALGASSLRVGLDQKRFTRRMRQHPTDAEGALWARLRKQQTGFRFARQRTILKYVVDFYCMSAGVAIEADGGYHSGSAEQIAYDKKRDRQLGELGVLVLRFTNEEIMNDMPSVMSRIIEIAQQRKGLRPLQLRGIQAKNASTLKGA